MAADLGCVRHHLPSFPIFLVVLCSCENVKKGDVWARRTWLGSASVDSEELRFRHQGKVQAVGVLSWFLRRLKSMFSSTQEGDSEGLSGLKVYHISAQPCLVHA